MHSLFFFFFSLLVNPRSRRWMFIIQKNSKMHNLAIWFISSPLFLCLGGGGYSACHIRCRNISQKTDRRSLCSWQFRQHHMRRSSIWKFIVCMYFGSLALSIWLIVLCACFNMTLGGCWIHLVTDSSDMLCFPFPSHALFSLHCYRSIY